MYSKYVFTTVKVCVYISEQGNILTVLILAAFLLASHWAARWTRSCTVLHVGHVPVHYS